MMGPLFLMLRSTPEQEHALQTLLDQQQDKDSVNYHHWLKPDEFGKDFGAEESDLQKIAVWLSTQGLAVDSVARGRRHIMFHGKVSDVESAFHTEIHRYTLNGENHFSNSTEISIPLALHEVVQGVLSLDDFSNPELRRWAANTRQEIEKFDAGLRPPYTESAGYHFISPGDFAVIYNTLPLLVTDNGGFGRIDGAGETIGIASIAYLNLSDVQTFRQMFLPSYNANNTNVSYLDANGNCCAAAPAPRTPSQAWESEAQTDVEWSGAVAPNATIEYVATIPQAATLTAYLSAIFASAAYIVDANSASVISVSFETCEQQLGGAVFNGLWQQAAAQGISVFVSSSDSGSAGCDDFSTENVATKGYAVNGVASTPYNIAVGGTQLFENGNDALYWSAGISVAATNNLPYTSALGYIPEEVWNESGAVPGGFGILAGSGGVSACNSKPPWQVGPGVPAIDPITPHPARGCPNPSGLHRYLPDVSLTAAIHDPYLLCNSDIPGGGCVVDNTGNLIGWYTTGGTSTSSPSFAGIQALVNQKYGRQGQANYVYYNLAAQQTTSACNSTAPGGPSAGCVFNDITMSTNGVPCAGGSLDCPVTTSGGMGILPYFSSDPVRNNGPGYDLASGLGSVNAANLLQQWPNAIFRSTTTTLEVTSPANGVASLGQPVTLTASVFVPSNQAASQEWGPPLQGSSVTFWDATNSVALGIGTLTYSGDFVATFVTSSLSLGQHSITATFTSNTAGTYYGFSTSLPTTVTVQAQTVPVVALSPSSLNFSPQLVGAAGTAQGVTLANTGDGALTISAITTWGDFSEANNCGANVSAQTNCVINVTFKPTAGGNRAGTLTVTDNATGSPQTVNLMGTGQDFGITLASGSSSTAAVAPGQTANYTLSFAPLGGLEATFALTCSGAPPQGACNVMPGSLALDGRNPATATVSVTTAAGSLATPRGRLSPPLTPEARRLLPLSVLLLALAAVAANRVRRIVPAISSCVRAGTDRCTRGLKSPVGTPALKWLPLAGALLVAALWLGCGGGGGANRNTGTPPGTYNLTITARTASGSTTLTHSMTLTLKVT